MMAMDFPWLRRIRVTFADLPPLESTGKQDALRISTWIHKEISGIPPSTTIKLYNLSAETRNALTESKKAVRIEAGWEQGPFSGLRECFKGTLFSAESHRERENIVTHVSAISGIDGLANTHIEDTFNPGRPVHAIVRELAKTIPGITVDSSKIKGIQGNIPDGGWSCCGKVKDCLAKLAREFQFSWTIVDDVFQAVGNADAFASTATIEEPYLIGVNPILTGPQRIKTGLKWACIYSPGITPGHFATIRSRLSPQHNGDYRDNVVTHYLDCYADNGFTSMAMAHELGRR